MQKHISKPRRLVLPENLVAAAGTSISPFNKAMLPLALAPHTLFSAADHEVAAASASALTAHATGVGTEMAIERGRGRRTACRVNTTGDTVSRASFNHVLCTVVSKF